MDTKENINKVKDFVKSKTFKKIIYVLGIIVITLMVFYTGMMAGFRKSSFNHNWGENYQRNFGFPNKMGGPEMMRGEFGQFRNLLNAHGAIGKIIKVELPSIIVLDEKDNTEKVVVIDDNTEIRKVRDSISKDDLKLDDHIIVIGSPNSSGQIEAKLIRYLPGPIDFPSDLNR